LQALIQHARLDLIRLGDNFERNKLTLKLCELGLGFDSTLKEL